jgi:uncharacterized membrane protein
MDNPMPPHPLRSIARVGPFYRGLATFAVSCFVGTLAADIAYWGTANMMWADFAAWLLTVGVIVGYVTLAVGLFETFVIRSPFRPTLAYAAGSLAALILATVNTLVHTRDAWTSVVPWGLVLSAAVVIILIITGWITRATDDAAVEVSA